MREKKWKKQILGTLLACAVLVTQLGVWNVGKEQVQAAETEVYKDDFGDYSVADWDYQWSNTTENTTFAAKWNEAVGNQEPALSIWTQTAQTLVLTHKIENLEAGDYFASVKTNGAKLQSGELVIESDLDGNKQRTDVAFEKENETATYKTADALTVSSGAITLTISLNLEEGGYGYLDDITLTKDGAGDVEVVDPVKDAPINVTKVSNLSSDFIMGMDISSMISELQSGVVYRDYDGTELATLDDICKFLSEQGINHIRIRVWNDPYDANGNGYGGGNNDVAKAKQFADACRNAGLHMLVDFHCSDLWTDPSKQQEPKAWKGYTLEQKQDALNAYITESLNTIDPSHDVVDMVQVGNETTSGFIGESDVSNMCVLFRAGAAGVRAYNPNVKVVIHVESPHKKTMTTWAKNLSDNNVDYDILATSYYPYWHGTLGNLKTEFETVKKTYQKDVMVAETSYAYTLEDSDGHNNTVRVGNNDDGADTTEPFTEQGQATAIRNLINTVNEAGGLGVYYWEPAWLTVGNTRGLTGDAYDAQVQKNKTTWETYGSGWASSYAAEYDAEDAGKWYGGSAVDNEAMFYPDGTATPALHVWNYVKTGAVSNLISVEGMDVALTQSITAGSSFTLPDTMAVTYSDSDTPVAETVTWNEDDVKKIDTAKVGTYSVAGTIALSKEITRGAYRGMNTAAVTFTLEVTRPNLITNEDVVEFNPAAQNLFTITGDGMFKEFANSENAKSGATCLSWWSQNAAKGTATYNETIRLEKGSYTFEAYAQGSDSSVTMQILDSSNQVLATGDAQAVTGWKDWKTPKVSFTLKQAAEVKLQIAVEVQEGGWGSVDVLYLHADGEVSDGGDSTPNTGSDTTGTTNTDTTTPAQEPTKADTTVVTATMPSGETVEVTVKKDASGNVTAATATITSKKAVLSAEVAAVIAKAAGTDNVAIKTEVTDANGNTKYTVSVSAKNLVANKKLKVVMIDKKTGAYKLVNAKTYQVGKDGTLNVKLADGADYQLLTPAETKAVEKAILKTVSVDKKSATVKNGASTKIKLSSKLDYDNVKSVTYTSGKKSVATVSKNGKITAKGKGTVTVKAKVTLKNGTTKTVSMKIKVK